MVPRVGVVILNWNGNADTLECLASFEKLADRPAIFVVDNGSTEDATELIEQRFPSVTCLRTPVNLGISGGNNLGVEAALAAGCRYVTLFNNDTIVAPDVIAHLVDACERDAAVGIVGALILQHDAPEEIQVAGFAFSDRFAFRLRVPNGRILVRGEGESTSRWRCGVEDVDAVSGCAMLVSRRVIDAIGGQDARYHAYFQDMDWCLRARRAGFRCVLAPAARVWHKGGRDTSAAWGRNSPMQQYWYMRDLCLFMRAQADLPRFLRRWLLVTARTAAGWVLDGQSSRQTLSLLRGSFAAVATLTGRTVRHPQGLPR